MWCDGGVFWVWLVIVFWGGGFCDGRVVLREMLCNDGCELCWLWGWWWCFVVFVRMILMNWLWFRLCLCVRIMGWCVFI